MRILKLKETANPEEIKKKLKASRLTSEYKKWHVLYIVSKYSVDAEYLSDTTGYSKAMIYNIVQEFNKSEKFPDESKPRGGRKRSYLSLSEEKDFMKALETKALKSQILTFHDIRKATEDKIGHAVSDDYIWDLFKRNGWTKHSPRPHHPLKDASKQDDFKKNSKTIWLPLKMILTQY
jgi:transposase